MDDSSKHAAEISKLKIIPVIIRAGSSRNEIVGYSEGKKAWVISVKEPADKNKANAELLRFLKRETGKGWRIKSGSKSREKILVSD